MRLLDRLGIAYESVTYTTDGSPKSGVEVARELQVSPEQIFKTLVARSGQHAYVFVIAADRELDLKKAAKVCGEKKIDMLPAKEIPALTGYQRGGCSPLGMKKALPTFVDRGARLQEAIYVSAGKIGVQIRLAPEDLLRSIGAEYGDLTEES